MANLAYPYRTKTEKHTPSTLDNVLRCDKDIHTPGIGADLQTASRDAFKIGEHLSLPLILILTTFLINYILICKNSNV